ncbi:MAG TPA: pectate lyase [Pirellulales bacterium]|jgi:hypothetical protein|nr:pectate lyase [Pirellulales bacterium]
MNRRVVPVASVCLFAAALLRCALGADDALQNDAREALRRAVGFYAGKVATHGGYVYQYSADLAKSEGEGKTDGDTVWVQPPGTPAIGMALVEAYKLTGEKSCLEAAKAAAESLLQGQLRSGCWNDRVEFDPERRAKFNYRVDPPRKKKPGFNWSSFDDDKTQSALRFLMRLDQVLSQSDSRLNEAVRLALDAVCKAQHANGGWPQAFEEPAPSTDHPELRASDPAEWSRKYPGGDYWVFYTLNDNAMADTIATMFLAAEVYGDERYRQAATCGGEFLLLARMPEPQPAWAQQYDFEMHPCWARKFEPPAITSRESEGAIEALLRVYEETGDRKFLEPIPRALEYLQQSLLPDKQFARFYELKTNKPLYFTRDYELTYDDSDMPTHYGFKVDNHLAKLTARYTKLAKLDQAGLSELRAARRADKERPKPGELREVIAGLDVRGAWVEEGRLRYHGSQDDTTRVIRSATFIKNLAMLSRYIGG